VLLARTDGRRHTSEASTILGSETSLLECIPLPSVTALRDNVGSAAIGSGFECV